MKTWRLFFLTAVCLLGLSGTASMEQAAAAEYREMFRAGNFYLVLKDGKNACTLAAYDGNRLERTEYGNLQWVASLNPLGALFGDEENMPEAMYSRGNYYQFDEDKECAFVLNENELTAENLDPRQGWNTLKRKLAVPRELSMLCEDDPFRPEAPYLTKPSLAGSGKKVWDKKEYDCDSYVSSVLSAEKQEIAQIAYDLFYDEGALIAVQSFLRQNGAEHPICNYEVKAIQKEIPPKAFRIPKKTKVYAAGRGDMDDLIERPVQVGTLEGLP